MKYLTLALAIYLLWCVKFSAPKKAHVYSTSDTYWTEPDTSEETHRYELNGKDVTPEEFFAATVEAPKVDCRWTVRAFWTQYCRTVFL